MTTPPPPTLVDRLAIAADRSAETLLEVFMDWTIDRGIELYPAQEEAILELLDGHHVVLNTPTGSGKSMVAVAAHFRAFARGERSYYTSPIKALVSEKFFDLCRTFGAENVGMQTGDGSINADALIVCCTAEVLSNSVLRRGDQAGADCVIMDEFHYYGDRDRGRAWQIPLLELTGAQFLLMSATLGDTWDISKAIEARTGRVVRLVRSGDRPVPLRFTYAETPLLETLNRLVDQDRAPVYVVSFSQRQATELTQDLMSTNFCSTEEKQAISTAIGNFRFDSPFGKKMRRYVHHGVGLHHAGLLPKYRLLVERLAQQGLLKVICGTDTLGVGVNVPIRTVLFTRLYKFDGDKRRILTVRDFHQIAGRAGRKGFDSVGYVVCQAPPHVIENSKLEAKASSGKGSKKFVRKQPEKGYVPWDAAMFEKLQISPPEALSSVFSVDHGMLLNLLQRDDSLTGAGGGYTALVDLIGRSHEHAGAKSIHRRHAARLFRALRDVGLVEIEEDALGVKRPVLAEELGDEFSAFHALSLYLVETISELPMDEDGLDLKILSACEAIVENPTPVLQAQHQLIRREAVAEMKADGIEYEERMEALEKLTYAKPEAEWLYTTFNAYVDKHPWLEPEHIRPKRVARELVERWMRFNQYVVELGLEASEGVLLRYLTDVWRVLDRTVPDTYKSDELEEVVQFLRATIAGTDSSLLQEWERLLSGEVDVSGALVVARKVALDADVRAFRSRLRMEMGLLVQALAAQDWEDAASCLRDVDDAWSAERLESEMRRYFETYEVLVADHRSRMAELTDVRPREGGIWEIVQTLVDPEDHREWFIRARVELNDDAPADGPLLELEFIGD
jgi:superfamily II RNA helicase